MLMPSIYKLSILTYTNAYILLMYIPYMKKCPNNHKFSNFAENDWKLKEGHCPTCNIFCSLLWLKGEEEFDGKTITGQPFDEEDEN